MTPTELDAVAAKHEREWGIGRLPLLVSPELATRWQSALDLLRNDHPPPGQTWDSVRGSLAKGWPAMAAEARARGHEPLPAPVAEAEWEPGRIFAVALNPVHKQALELRAKADERTSYSVWTVAELATLVRSIPIVSNIKDMFAGAEILPPCLPPVGRVPMDDLGPVLEPEIQEASA